MTETKPTITTPPAASVLPIGIHFGLPAERHHADPGHGSSDIRKLARNPSSYWYNSYMNPSRPVSKQTPGRLRGSAMHCLVYDGEAKFDATYMRGPDQDDMSTSEKTASTKKANERAAQMGLDCLKAVDYDRVVIAAAMITRNPALKNVFTGGMPEVTVVYEQDGIRRKVRWDYLKIRGIGDLKGCANTKDIAFPAACRNDITNYSYHEQASWYLDARAALPKLVADGCVHGDHDPEWLKKVCTAKQVGWQWIFFCMEGAPITWSAILSPDNPLVEIGRRANERAVEAFKRYRKEFGTDIWLLVEEPRELPLEELPPWLGK